MNKTDLQNAISGINRDFISESDDFKTVSADFRKDKNRKKSILVSAFCLVFVGIGVLGVYNSGLLKRDVLTAENVVDSTIPTVSNTTAVQPETTAAVMTEHSTSEAISSSHATENSKSVTADNNTQHETTEAPAYPNETMRDIIAVKSINGIVYQQFFPSGVYTCGEYIGESSEFIGFPEQGNIYLSNESPDVIIIRFNTDSQVTLEKTDISPEQYQQAYEQMKETMMNKPT